MWILGEFLERCYLQCLMIPWGGVLQSSYQLSHSYRSFDLFHYDSISEFLYCWILRTICHFLYRADSSHLLCLQLSRPWCSRWWSDCYRLQKLISFVFNWIYLFWEWKWLYGLQDMLFNVNRRDFFPSSAVPFLLV